MASIAAILAAVAATVAAGVTGLSLYVAGRREHDKWVRDALIEAYVSYLNASFEGGSASRKLLDPENVKVSEQVRAELVEYIVSSRKAQNDTLTRLRLLADSKVVGAAEELLLANRAAGQVAVDSARISGVASWDVLRKSLWDARNKLIDAARQSMHLSPGKPVDPRLTFWPVQSEDPNQPDGASGVTRRIVAG